MLASSWLLVRATVRAPADADADGAGTDTGTRTDTDTGTRSIEALEALKARVPAAVDAVGRRAWESIVGVPVPSQIATRPPSSPSATVASRAYYKMRELMCTCAIPPPDGPTVHLCEAPGGFVQAVADAGPSDRWSWLAISLGDAEAPQFHPQLPYDRGRVVTADVAHGLDDHVPRGTAVLVTADGATDVPHDRLEEAHFPLLVAQARAAVHCLAPGGWFVLKLFEGGRRPTQHLVAQLTREFAECNLIKPVTSRATNSERYLVCREYRPIGDTRLGAPVVIADGWLVHFQSIADRLAEDQVRSLARALSVCDGMARRSTKRKKAPAARRPPP